MEVKGIINRISSIEKEVYNYIVNTEHWLFYWIANKEVQDFIKKYPNDYCDRVHLRIKNLSSSPYCEILFDDHPNGIGSIERYAVLNTFRIAVEAKWSGWSGEIKERQIEQKEKELAYFKYKVSEIEKEISDLKNTEL